MSKFVQVIKAVLPHRLSAVILAAGKGERMGSDCPKQFIQILGKTPLERSVEAFECAVSVDDIIIVTSEDYLSSVKQTVAEKGYKKVSAVVVGGKTRFESSFKGMEAVDGKTTHIAVHDAARCLVTSEMIDKVAAAAFRNDSAFASMPVVDTVKQLDKNGLTLPGSGILNRSKLVLASTPQIFKLSLYCAAAYSAKKEGYEGSDDCSLVEHAGFSCTPVDTGRENIKITTPSDIATAEFILRNRGEN